MRILIAIAMILAGLGAIAWSYIGAFAQIGEEMSLAADPFTAFFQMLAVMESIASGDIPQMTGFLYAGLLSIAIAIVTLFFGRSRNHDDADTV